MKRYEEALRDADQAIALVPKVAGVWVERGNILHGLNPTSEALKSYEQALVFDPRDHAAWIYIIRMLGHLRRYHDALHACEEGAQVFIQQPKRRIGILIEQAQILERIKRYTEAVALAEQIVEQDMGIAEAWETLGVALASAKRLDEALTANERAAALDPFSIHLANNASQTMYMLDRQQEALMSYDQTLARFPDAKRTRELRAYVLARLIARGQLPDGYSLAETPELDHPTYWRTEAEALERLGEYEAAIAACDEGFRRYPAAATLLITKALFLVFHFGRFRDALQVFSQAIQAARTYRRESLL
jgi:tetratricopeptide (TPR) repeat protein